MAHPPSTAIGVLTSGGDAQGMNAALRAVTRSALTAASPSTPSTRATGDGRRRRPNPPLAWDDVGGIIQRGGTVIGTARCAAFRERAGRLPAAQNLIERGIDRLVVIGGDGSLTGADLLRQEWPSLLAELVGRRRCRSETSPSATRTSASSGWSARSTTIWSART